MSPDHYPAAEVFFGAPFARNDLHLVNGVVPGRTRRALWNGYAGLRQRKQLLKMLAAAGVEDRLAVEDAEVSANPSWSELCRGFGGCRVTGTGVSEDYRIPQLAGMLALRDPAVSRMVFVAIAEAGAAVMRARWSPNRSYSPHQQPSQLAQVLRSAAWLPARDGTFRCPIEIAAPELAEGFPLQGNMGWLDLIGFGERERQRSERHVARLRAAESIGLPNALAERLAAMDEDARAALGAEMLRRIEEGAFTRPEFPTRQSASPGRRETKVAERARAAPERTFETRNRSVRTTAGDVRDSARLYLRDLYTNDAGQMICQGCREEMPFRLPDDRHYFEAVALVAGITVELAENHLALCPTCAAKWRHARETEDGAVEAAIAEAQGLAVAVRLAGDDVGIHFVELHLEDIRTALGATSTSRPI